MKFLKPKFWDKSQISLFSIFLLPISLLIKLLLFFKKNFTKAEKFPIPVICVGNIYLGGAGKTPLCIEIFSILKNLNKNPAFIRKRYNSFKDEVNLQKTYGGVYESNKRVDAVKKAIENNIDSAILDDGFQDFSINKNLSIICFNEKQWIGNGFTIPAGPLRESLSSLKRASCVVINGKKNLDIEKKILEINNEIKIFYTVYKPLNIDDFINQKIISFAGIGNPINFFNLLKDNNIKTTENISFPDHYNYSDDELKNLINKAEKNNSILLTTEKDYYRINDSYKKKIRYIKIKIVIENKNQLINEIKKIL